MRILITVANYNTSELLAHLLFSLFRVMGRRPLRNCDILIVDNNSADDSVPILKALEKQKLIRVIYNKKQKYHAPALNQGLEIAIREKYDIFWSLDSDTVVLRSRTIRDAVHSFENHQAAMMAQYNNSREAHVSCMMLRVSTAEKLRGCFNHGGNPSRYLQRQYRQSNVKVLNFPFRQNYYILHVGCGTRKAIKEIGDTSNAWFSDMADCSPWYHGDPLAPTIHDNFKRLFKDHVPKITPRAMCEACATGGLLRLRLPKESPGPDPGTLSPTARGRRALKAKEKKSR